MLQEEVDGRSCQLESELEQDDALKIAELFPGEVVATQGEQLLHSGRSGLNLFTCDE